VGRPAETSTTGYPEAEIGANSVIAGREVRELSLPQETLLVAIRRGERTLIPHGDTVLMAGDRVVALAERGQFEALRELLGRRAEGRSGPTR
jgi:Trk K+ transport system NAD-binding subunit